MFTASLVLHLTLISPLMSLFYSSFSDIYHNYPHISLHLLLLLATSNFLSSIMLSFIFLYILIPVYHNATGLSLLLTPLSLVHTSFLALILNFLLSTIHVKNARSGLKLFLFLFLFLFSFWFIFLYSIFRTRTRVRVTISHCHTAGHIRWHGYKLHDVITQKV